MKRSFSLIIALCLNLTLLLAACVAPSHTIKTAFADATYDWAKWRLQVRFPAAGTVEATWLVDIGHTVAGSKVTDIAHSEPVPCLVNGAVTITPGKASFSGVSLPGWITCAIPDYAATISRLTGGAYTLPPTCTPKTGWAAADLLPVFSTSALPVVHMPNLHLMINNPSPAPATLEFRLGSTTMTSAPFVLPLPLHSWAGADSDYGPVRFMSGGVPFGPTHLWPGYSMSTGATTVTLGHNPVTGAFYSGELYWVEVDPGCQTN